MTDRAAISFEACQPIEADALQVMTWRNDPVTLSVSFHQQPKIWESFWPEFVATYFSNGRGPHPVFALADGKRVGFLRFSPAAHPLGLTGRIVDISINLAPEARGRGLGPAVLKASLDHLRAQGVSGVVAEILPRNEASVRAFSTAGFTPVGAGSKQVADTGETHEVTRFVADLTADFWRRGRVYVVAEAGSNWRMGTPKRDRAMARALIDVAVEAGADAVKFQTYNAQTVYVANAGQSDYLAEAGVTEDISTIFADLAMPHEMLPDLADYCRRCGIDFMSTPFSPADFAAIDPFVAVHKIASYEISHVHLLTLAARSGKPLILSTGACDESDVAWAVDSFRAEGGKDLCLLQCTAKYPAPIAGLNLATIPWLAERFGVAAGLSDHSRVPSLAPVMAVALGARVIEKHYTLDNRLPGPDHSFALTASELSALVRDVRMAEEALGDGVKRVLDAEAELAGYAKRGLQATRAIAEGEILREDENYAVLRPGQRKLGVHPKFIPDIEGRPAKRAIGLGEGLSLDDIAT